MKLAPPPIERADDATGGGSGPPPRPAGGGRQARVAKTLRIAAVLIGVIGVLALVDGVLTLVWQEPISGLLAHFQQARLAKDLKQLESERATPAELRALAALPSDNARMAYFARQLQHTARAGQPLGRIRIPRIGADYVVVAGTDESSLKKGPGVYAGTSLPGLPGTVGIAGHRTTYLAPFRRINELAKGDRITLEMPYGLFSYQVLGHRIVKPNDVSVLASAPYDQLVLTACNPLYSAAQRIVVFARLTAAAPAGPALSLLGAAPPAAAPATTIPAALAAAAVLGDVSPDVGSPGEAPPEIDPGTILIGPSATAPAPAGRAAPRPATAAHRAATPAAPAHKPVSTPAPAPTPVARAPIRTPAPTPTPTPTVVRHPAPTPVKKPSAAKSPASSAPSTGTAAAPPQQQTRVQGTPSGPTPIIGVPSG